MRHEERNDALLRGNKLALNRYIFAIKCLGSQIKRIVDCGCGMGYGTKMMETSGHYVIGVDYSKEAIDYSSENYGGNFQVLDLENDKLPESDVVVCLECLCHLKDPKGFIDKIKAKEIVVSSPINPNPNDGYPWRKHNLKEREFKDLLKGWTIINELKQKGYLTIYAKKNEDSIH